MIASQRHRRIVEYVLGRGAGKVTELAREFGVTEETIRRDLRALSQRGELARTHGGAVPTADSDAHVDLPYLRRDAANAPAKAAIGRAALAFVVPGEVIALDASSTAFQLARLLPDEPLTVVTNSFVVCSLLARRERIQVVCTGGTLDPEAAAFTGLHARRTLAALNIHTAFFSCRGVDLERGLSEANDRNAELKLQMIESSRQRVLLLDSSKIGVAAAVFTTPVGIADHVIVEHTDDPEARRRIERLRAVANHVVEAAPG